MAPPPRPDSSCLRQGLALAAALSDKCAIPVVAVPTDTPAGGLVRVQDGTGTTYFDSSCARPHSAFGGAGGLGGAVGRGALHRV